MGIRILEGYRFEYTKNEINQACELWLDGWDYRDIADSLEIEEVEAFMLLTHLSTTGQIKKRVGGIFGSDPYHPNEGKEWTEQDLEYLAKYYKFDGAKSVSLGLGRTSKAVKTKYDVLKRSGKLENILVRRCKDG